MSDILLIKSEQNIHIELLLIAFSDCILNTLLLSWITIITIIPS